MRGIDYEMTQQDLEAKLYDVERIDDYWWWKGIEGFSFVTKPTIDGCCMVPLVAFYDDRGRLVQVLSEDAPKVVHCYYSVTNPGEARDIDAWHMHRIQTDRFAVVSGYAIVGLSDGHEMQRVMLSSATPNVLVIPPNVYHCFRPYTDTYVFMLNHPTERYNPDDELRIPFAHLNVESPW